MDLCPKVIGIDHPIIGSCVLQVMLLLMMMLLIERSSMAADDDVDREIKCCKGFSNRVMQRIKCCKGSSDRVLQKMKIKDKDSVL